MLGLKHGTNLLVDYDPAWRTAFEDERARIQSSLGEVVHGIEHYGSTAVEGLRAKPIIDILVGVEPLDAWARCRGPLEQLGYDYAENAGVPAISSLGGVVTAANEPICFTWSSSTASRGDRISPFATRCGAIERCAPSTCR